MKTMELHVNESIYDTLLAMLKGLPKKDIEIIEFDHDPVKKDKSFDINKAAGILKSFADIEDPVTWQRKIRSEWDRDWDR